MCGKNQIGCVKSDFIDLKIYDITQTGQNWAIYYVKLQTIPKK
jgi:hypothetical protein